MARSTFFRRTSRPALMRSGARWGRVVSPAATSFSVTAWADSPGTATMAICRLRALASFGSSCIGWVGAAPAPLAPRGGAGAKEGEEAEPRAREAFVVEEGRAEIAEAHQRPLPLPVETEDALQLGLESRDVVADAGHPDTP